MEHHSFVAYQLGELLDLPADFVWSDDDRRRSMVNRHLRYPLSPE
jgi:hypothetical protein